MKGEIRSYHQLGAEYEAHVQIRTKKDLDDRLLFLCLKHEVGDVNIEDLKPEDFREDSEEAEDLFSTLGEMGAFNWKSQEDYED